MLQQLTIAEKLCTNIYKDFLVPLKKMKNQFRLFESLAKGIDQKKKPKQKNRRPQKTKRKKKKKDSSFQQDHDGPGDQICAQAAGR